MRLCFVDDTQIYRFEVKTVVNVTINGGQIPLTDVTKNLGVSIDLDLRFGTHVSRTLKKAYFSHFANLSKFCASAKRNEAAFNEHSSNFTC